MKFELNEDEATELRNLLDVALRDLSYEIADTDRSTFKEGLRSRREALESLRERLGEAPFG